MQLHGMLYDNLIAAREKPYPYLEKGNQQIKIGASYLKETES